MRAAIVAGLVLMTASTAAAAPVRKLAPPGNSAISQYVESVPTAGGGKPTSAINVAGHDGSGALPSSTQRAFSRAGPDARAAARLAVATAPSATLGVAAATASQGSGGGPAGSRAGAGSAPLTSILNAAAGTSSSAGLGPWLPAILLVTAISLGAVALWRRRPRGSR